MKSKKLVEVSASDLLNFVDEFAEFHGYCAFLCDAFGCLALECETLDPDTASGVKIYGESLKRRSGKLKEELRRIQESSREPDAEPDSELEE